MNTPPLPPGITADMLPPPARGWRRVRITIANVYFFKLKMPAINAWRRWIVYRVPGARCVTCELFFPYSRIMYVRVWPSVVRPVCVDCDDLSVLAHAIVHADEASIVASIDVLFKQWRSVAQ